MKRIFPFILALAVVIFNAVPVHADMAAPDTTPTMASIHVYRNLRTPGDALFLVYANIPYASLPALSVNDAFVWQLKNTDGVTQLGTTTGYAFHDKGYNYNLYSLYIESGITWNTAYPIKLVGNPTAFSSPPSYSFSVAGSDFSTNSEQSVEQAELAARVLAIAQDLNVRWTLSFEDSLIISVETKTVLSTYGQSFFRGAITNIQDMAPALFTSVVVDTGDLTSRTWNSTYSDALKNQYNGTWLDSVFAAGPVLWGTADDLMTIIITFAMCVGLIVSNIMIASDMYGGLHDAGFLMVITARLGFYGLGFLILVAAMCILYLGFKIFRPM